MTVSQQKNILHSLRLTAREHPEKTCAVIEGERISFGAFIRNVDALSTKLTVSDVRKDDIVALILPNSITWLKMFWAIVAVDATPLPLDPQIGAWELKQLCSVLPVRGFFAVGKYRANRPVENVLGLRYKSHRRPFVVMVDSQQGAAADEFDPPDLSDEFERTAQNMDYTDLLMYALTSGTTGNPKIISVPHTGFFQSQKDMADYLSLSGDDVMLLGMPLYHQGGFGMGVQALLSGATVIYQMQFDPPVFLKMIKENGVTVVQLTPTLAKILLSVPGLTADDLRTVRCIYFAGEVLPDTLAATFYRGFGIRVVNIIGSSETATMVVWDSDTDQGTGVNDFRPLSFTRVKVADTSGNEVATGGTGVLYVSTDALLNEYTGNPVETGRKLRKEGQVRWFDTGDLCKRLDSGRVRFVGRKKRVIKRGANLLYPEEIEMFLLTHPAVDAVAIVKRPHDIFGETAVAYVEVRKGTMLKRGDLVSFCRGRIASYKVPDKVFFVDSIPKDIGKVQFKYLARDNSV